MRDRQARDLDQLHAQLRADHPQAVPEQLEFHGLRCLTARTTGLPPPSVGFQGVDVDRLRQRPGWEDAKPHIVVSAQLLNRVHRRTSLRADGLLVIADDHHLRDDSRLTYRRMRAASVQGLSDGALDHLLDTMYFGPSNQSRLLQAVDVLTYFEQRRRHVTERHRDAVRRMNAIGRSLNKIRQHSYVWTP